MNTFEERLREERNRLGFSQADFAEIGGVQRLAQINYEKGKRNPDSPYLASIAAAGVDVQYILTGIRSASAPKPVAEPLSQRKKILLDNYDNTSEEGRRIIEGTASAAAQPAPAKKSG